MGVWDVVLRFRDANDQHDLIVRANDVPINTPALWVVRPAAVVIELWVVTRIVNTCALYDIIVRGAALCMLLELVQIRPAAELTSAWEVRGPSLVIFACVAASLAGRLKFQ